MSPPDGKSLLLLKTSNRTGSRDTYAPVSSSVFLKFCCSIWGGSCDRWLSLHFAIWWFRSSSFSEGSFRKEGRQPAAIMQSAPSPPSSPSPSLQLHLQPEPKSQLVERPGQSANAAPE
ncbi:hypothetical protein Dda_8463 [Drechslerella dactyloides]|uniref:Uncharacterized protein n=1 Tax=Drechslerella dactyloides TaxID=74499 RepID=A0AAD6NHA9_DREDA|nr:hypothetical protein Dda_8463 [Drechslerella dactyloides]